MSSESLIVTTDEETITTQDLFKIALVKAIGTHGLRLNPGDFSVTKLDNNKCKIYFVVYRREGIRYAISQLGLTDYIK